MSRSRAFQSAWRSKQGNSRSIRSSRQQESPFLSAASVRNKYKPRSAGVESLRDSLRFGCDDRSTQTIRYVATPIRHEYGQRSFQRHGRTSDFRAEGLDCDHGRPAKPPYIVAARQFLKQSPIDRLTPNIAIAGIRTIQSSLATGPRHKLSQNETLRERKPQERTFNHRKYKTTDMCAWPGK